MTNGTHKRASKGGEIAPNGEFYRGGQFINTVPENEKGSAKSYKPTGKQKIEKNLWDVHVGRHSIYVRIVEFIKFQENPKVAELWEETTDTLCRRNGGHSLEEIKELISRFNAGERWL